MATSDPVVMKKTPIAGFSQHEWSLVSNKIMEQAISLKFSQNNELKEILKSTSGKIIAEASPSDKY